MEQIISKEKAQELMEIKGEVRGAIFKTDVGFIIEEKGEEGLKRIEEEMKRLGYPLEYNKIRAMSFYPIGLRAVSLLVIKKVLGFSDEKIKEMGSNVPKSSFIIRLSLRFLSFAKSPELWYKNASKLWKQFTTIGEFNVPEFNEENKIVIDRIKDFNIHPILCIYLSGALASFQEIARGFKGVSSRETKCTFRGDDYHEFSIKW